MNEVLPTVPVLGLPVHLSDHYTAWLISRLQQGKGSHVVTLNAEMAMQGEYNPPLGDVIRSADLVIPDGSGIVLYLRWKGKSIKRCPGIELAESLLRYLNSLSTRESVVFFGGSPGIGIKAAEEWSVQLPNIMIIPQHGYLSSGAEEESFKNQLKELQPSLIFVGLGVPRQEFWIKENRHLCPQSIWVGVGGSIDIWAGNKTRAPAWFRDNHLEWLYRLYKEPWRWKRMLALPQFALKAILWH